MSEKTAAALAQVDKLLPMIQALPPGSEREGLLETGEALRRAVAAFHLEAIRFRMYSVERSLARIGRQDALEVFKALRSELEAAGFHTRSHAAP
jgi:hypothetical protein